MSPCPAASGIVVPGAEASRLAVLIKDTIQAPPSRRIEANTQSPVLLGAAVRTTGRGSLSEGRSGSGSLTTTARLECLPPGGGLLRIDPENQLLPDLIDHKLIAAHIAIDDLLFSGGA